MENCPSKYLVDNSKEISSRCFEDVGNSFNDQVELSFEFFFWCKQTYSKDSVDIIDVLSCI